VVQVHEHNPSVVPCSVVVSGNAPLQVRLAMFAMDRHRLHMYFAQKAPQDGFVNRPLDCAENVKGLGKQS